MDNRLQSEGLALLLLVLLGVMPTRSVYGDQFHGINAGAVVWNNSLILTPQRASQIAATGTKSIRINFRLSAEAGVSSWGAAQLNLYDQVIQNARNAGLNILGLFSNETVAGGQVAWNNDSDLDGMNAYVDEFADTAHLLVDRYKNDVTQWEIWNEPNSWTNYNPDQGGDPKGAGGTYILPRVYANLHSETYRHLNTGGQSLLDDHDMSLVSGGLFGHDIGGSFSTAMPYMQQVYDETAVWNSLQSDTGRLYPWDDIGYHFYLSQGSPVSQSQIANYFNAVRSTQTVNNDPADVLVTEFSWRTDGSNTEQLQRDNMATTYDYLESKAYVSGSYWYQWKDESPGVSWGIVNISETSEKLSYAEFVARNQTSPGDFDGNGAVDGNDLTIWQTALAASQAGDADGDGDTDGADFLIWQQNYSQGLFPTSASIESVAVPEPSTAGLFVLSTLWMTSLGQIHRVSNSVARDARVKNLVIEAKRIS